MPNPLTTIAGYFQAPAAGAPPIAQQAAAPQTPGGYSVLDVLDRTQVCATVAANGLVTVTFDPVNSGQVWQVGRMVVYSSSAAATVAFVYVGDPQVQNLRDASASGNLDIADNASPLLVPGSRSLVVQWVGASDGATALCSIQGQVLG